MIGDLARTNDTFAAMRCLIAGDTNEDKTAEFEKTIAGTRPPDPGRFVSLSDFRKTRRRGGS